MLEAIIAIVAFTAGAAVLWLVQQLRWKAAVATLETRLIDLQGEHARRSNELDILTARHRELTDARRMESQHRAAAE